MSFKSISSFLATILLIGFTISTGIIVYYFASTLPRTQTQQISSQASKVLSCAGAMFDVKVRNCNLLNGLVLWLPMDEGSGNITYDYFRNDRNATYYSSGLQENSTLLQLNSSIVGEHDIYINDVPSESIFGAVHHFEYSAPQTTEVKIYVNGNLQRTVTVPGVWWWGWIGNLKPNSWNNITYVVNNTINITLTRIGYNFVSSEAKMCYNNDCQTAWSSGVFGKALSFNAIRNWMETQSLQGNREMSFLAWVYDKSPSDLGGSGKNPVIAGEIAYIDSSYNSGQYRVVLYTGDFFEYCMSRPRNVWHHVALVVSDSGKYFQTYLNAQAGCYKSLSASFNPGVFKTYIGGSSMARPLGLFNGTIDEVRVYNRALSEDEIKELYYEGLTNKFNITIGLLNSGYADLGNSFTAIVYLKNGTILQLPLILDNNLSKGYYLEKTLTIDGYYPSYGLVDKIMVCSNDCQGVCSEIIVNNQC
jgi:hypothetical protein